MIQYAAVHYVRIGRQTFTPGEIIDVVIPDEKRDHLLERGAIRNAGAPFVYAGQDDVKPVTEEEKVPLSPGDPLVIKAQIEMLEKASLMPELGAEGQPDVDADEEGAEGQPDGENDEDDGELIQEDAPVIDAMDGVIPPQESADQSATKAEKKPKTSGRGKAK